MALIKDRWRILELICQGPLGSVPPGKIKSIHLSIHHTHLDGRKGTTSELVRSTSKSTTTTTLYFWSEHLGGGDIVSWGRSMDFIKA
jgi:hypothetical protein